MNHFLTFTHRLPNAQCLKTLHYLLPIDFSLSLKVVVYTYPHRVLYVLLDSIDHPQTPLMYTQRIHKDTEPK